MRYFIFVVVVLSCVGLQGQSPAPPAKVVLLRPYDSRGLAFAAAGPIIVLCDGQALGTSSIGTYSTVELAPGDHIMVVQNMRKQLRLTVTSGKTYYVLISTHLLAARASSTYQLESISESEAADRLKKLVSADRLH
jgi:hypothetical protein